MTTKPIPRLILISSLTGPQSGKSTIASYLENEYGYQVVSFASGLKLMVQTLLLLWNEGDAEMTERQVYGDLKEVPIFGMGENSPVTARWLMQSLGTEWRNMVDRDLWVKLTIRETRDCLRRGFGVVIDDLRFPHEYEALKREFGEVMMHLTVTRPDNLYQNVNHASEDTSWINEDNTDARLVNDTNLNGLLEKVDLAVSNWGPSEPSDSNQTSL